MAEITLEVEDMIIQALNHKERRELLKIISLSATGSSYSELMVELGLPTGKLNYQLKQLEGLIEKNEERRYVLTPLGRKAIELLTVIKRDINVEYEKYIKAAHIAQKSTFQRLSKSLLIILISFVSLILSLYGYMFYIIAKEGGPPLIYIMLPILMTLVAALLIWLVYALKNIGGRERFLVSFKI